MLGFVKETHPNTYIIIVSIFLAIWFIGVTDIIRYVLPERSWKTSVIMCLIVLIIFFSDDEELSELHESRPPETESKKSKSANLAAIISAIQGFHLPG